MKKRVWLIASVIVVASIGMYLWSGASHPDNTNVSSLTDTVSVNSPFPTIEVPEVTPSPIISSEQPSSPPIVAPEISPQATPSEAPILQPDKEVIKIEVPISKPKTTSKPTEPPKPKVKEPEKVKSSATPPKYDEKQTEPNKETATAPKAGDKNDKGQVYVPGFGWVDDNGPNQEINVGNEGDELTGNKVGSMD
ncbi:DUF6550 family protein [Paenibacillus taichungensis]